MDGHDARAYCGHRGIFKKRHLAIPKDIVYEQDKFFASRSLLLYE
jgi:hypothetical protein